MKLKVKLLRWSAGLPVAMLNHKTAEKMGVQLQDRIQIKTLSRHPKTLVTIIDLTDKLVKEDEVATSSEIKQRLKLRIGQKIDVSLASPPKSFDFIKKKMNGGKLSKSEIHAIIADVVNNSLTDSELALFVSGMYQHRMNLKETISLIEAISGTGNRLKLRSKFVVDKHCIGGIPGNRTTPIVVSICAAAGLIIPKSSSRAITSAAGTADVIESIARVDFNFKEVKKIIQKTGACLIWGGSLGMVPADSKIIKVEKDLKIDPEAQLLASILAKKLAFGSKYILIDIPYGKHAKVSKIRGYILKKKFEYLGKHFHKKLKCVLTNGDEPIGNGIGPILELKDIIQILDPKKQGPVDLEKKSLFLAGELLEMTGKAKEGNGIALAKEIIDSGKALKKFKDIIKAQEGDLNRLKNGDKPIFTKDIHAYKSGKIKLIENKKISSLAKVAGCPSDKFAGIYLYVHLRDKVDKGDKILTLYAESKSRLNQAINFYEEQKPILIR
ncbi:MAG TPA: thymidine phosphorylase family protein [Candidatus Nanoarchaeia archaeon]|nr:thymidine phosphorylase family protein [Candidatus Nanoarchaeia archaeon]